VFGYRAMRTDVVTKEPTLADQIFVVLVLLYSTAAFLPVLQGDRAPNSGAWLGTLVTNVLWILIYANTLRLLLRRVVSPFADLKRNWALVILVGLAPLSLFWSDARLLTFLKSGSLIGTALISLYLVRQFSTRRILVLGGWALGIAWAATIVFVVWIPKYGLGTDEFQGDWLGVYGQKNNLGSTMATAFLMFFLLSQFTPGRKLRYLSLSFLALVEVYLSDSTTSLVICLLLPAIFWMTRICVVPSKYLTWRRVAVLLLLGSIALTTACNFEQLTTGIGKDPTLTGRTALWLLVLGAIAEKPMLGYGYEAFWRVDQTSADEIWARIGQDLFYSHNGWLEVWLGLGIGAVVLITSILGLTFYRALGLLRQRFCLETAWYWMFLCYLVLSNLTEASLMRSNTLAWILFLCVLQQVAQSKNPGSIKKYLSAEMVVA